MQHSAVLEVLGRERAHVRRDVDERLPADSAHAAEGARDGEAAGPVAERGDGVVDAGDVEDRRDRLDALAWAAEQVGARVGEDELCGGTGRVPSFAFRRCSVRPLSSVCGGLRLRRGGGAAWARRRRRGRPRVFWRA